MEWRDSVRIHPCDDFLHAFLYGDLHRLHADVHYGIWLFSERLCAIVHNVCARAFVLHSGFAS